MNGRVGTEPVGQDAECAVVLRLTGRPEGRRQRVAVDGEPDHERPSGWEPSSAAGSGVRAASAALLALAPLPDTSTDDLAAVARAARLVDGLTDRELREVVPLLPALCWAELDLDRFAEARTHLDRALSVASSIRHREALPGLLLTSSVVAGRQGRLIDAGIDAQEAVARAGQLDRVDERAVAMAAQLPTRLWQHGPDAARGLLATMPAPQSLSVGWWRPIVATASAEALLLLGDQRAARRVAVVALDLASGRGGAQYPALLALAAITELACGRLAAAAVLQRQAGSAAEAGGLDTQCGAAGVAQARVLLAGGAYRAAAAAAATAVVRLERCGAPILAGRARMVAAEIATAVADHDLAWSELALARSAFLASGAHWLATTAATVQHRLGR